MNTRLEYKFERINVGEYSDEELTASDNRFAWALLIAKQALLSGKNWEQRLLEKKWMIFRLLYENGLFQDRKLLGLFVFMKHSIPFDDLEISCIFEERCDSLTGKTKTMDIFEQVAQMQLEETSQEGEKKGMQEGEKRNKEAPVGLASVFCSYYPFPFDRGLMENEGLIRGALFTFGRQ